MTTHSLHSEHASGLARSRLLIAILSCAAFLMVPNAQAQSPSAQSATATAGASTAAANSDLEKLVGPIALYPDDLVAIILPAATNPLQLVQADRYLEKRKADKSLPIDEKWDDAVKSLLNYPEVVKKMSADLDWTTALGEAVVADQSTVLEAVQVFRRKAQSADNLKSDSKQTIIVEKEVIKIVQADPQVIYVPQYNPTTVVVAGTYPTMPYYPAPYPVYYYPYPPGAAFATGLIWGAAIGAAWNGGHYHADYHGGGNNINIDRSTNINVNRSNTANQLPAGGSSQWKPNKQPGQVARPTSTPSNRAGYSGSGAGAGGGSAQRPSSQPADRGNAGMGAGNSGSQRPSAQPADRGNAGMGAGNSGSQRPSASTQPANKARGGETAFDRNASGRQTQMDSSRGASSRSSMSGSGSRQMSRSGGSGRASRR
jgi:hypothetical protein